MAIILKDRVKVSATTTGTGTFTLGSTSNTFQSFAIIGDGNQTYYTIAMQAGSVLDSFEVGIGTVTDTGGVFTLSRTTVLESSNAGSLVDFPAGTKDVFVTYPAERAVFLNAAGTAVDVLNVATLGATAANLTTATITSGTVSATPTIATDITNKEYVDTLVAAGTHFHEPVRVESPVNISATYDNGTAGVGATLTNAGAQAALVIDGITLDVADRVLIYEQTNQTQNGVYVVTDVGSGATNWVLTRADDADTYAVDSPNGLSEGSTFFVREGTTGAGETYTCNTAGTITFGTTNITFAQVAAAQIYSAGTGLTLTSTQFSITNVGTAGTFGAAAQVPVFTTNAQGQVIVVTNTAIAITSAAVSGLAPSATTDTTNASNITTGTLGTGRLTGSYTGITGVGTLTAGVWNGSVIDAVYGGTGFGSYTVGDLLFANTTTSLAKLAGVAVGNALISGGVGSAPVYGKIGLATHVSGTLPVANGGTGVTSATGTGSVVLSSSPTLVTPALGTPASGNLANCTFPTLNQNTTGNATTATTLQTARTIGGVSFNGSANINLPGVNVAGNQNTTGSAASLTTARTIGGVSFNGTANINLPGVNIGGNQSTTGNAATATTLQTARTIGGVSFNGSANINLPGVNVAGNQNTTGSAASVSGTTTAAISTSALGSGTANSTTFLRGDRTFQVLSTPSVATTAEAQAGTNNTNFITPLRLREGFNAGGTAPVFAVRAWVNFDGSAVSIRGSGNVSSITRHTTGQYSVNFTTAMQDVNYCATTNIPRFTSSNNTAGSGMAHNSSGTIGNGAGAYFTTRFRLITSWAVTVSNPRHVSVAISR